MHAKVPPGECHITNVYWPIWGFIVVLLSTSRAATEACDLAMITARIPESSPG